MADITRKTSRVKLKIRREPYWQRLAAGAYLGFRRGPETWIARFRGRDGKQQYRALDGLIEYDDAKKSAEEWLSTVGGTAVRSVKRDTVRKALERYLKHLRTQGRHDAADEAEGRFRLTVYGDDEEGGRLPDLIANLSLESATRDDFDEWRERLRTDAKGEPRQPRSINRHVRAVVAGLNKAHELGHVGNREAWQLTALSDDVDDEGETAVMLAPEQRRAVIAAASVRLSQFLRGLELTGCRPKELAATTANDFDGEALRVSHRKGRPPKLRVRRVVLGPEGVGFFRAQSADKLPSALLFTEDGQLQWRRHVWAKEFREAVVKANESLKGKARIPVKASAYSYRHARISELLQIHGVDPLTTAQQTGTSIAMIERAYLKFIPAALADKLAAIKEA